MFIYFIVLEFRKQLKSLNSIDGILFQRLKLWAVAWRWFFGERLLL